MDRVHRGGLGTRGPCFVYVPFVTVLEGVDLSEESSSISCQGFVYINLRWPFGDAFTKFHCY